MEYTIKAIPTTYRGVRFRSRLEARWAAFFDKMGWMWTYEPYDLDGWAPDFEIKRQGSPRSLFEIKPFLWENKNPFDFIDKDLRAKVARHGGFIAGAEMHPRVPNEHPNTFAVQFLTTDEDGPTWRGARVTDCAPARFDAIWREAAAESKREYA